MKLSKREKERLYEEETTLLKETKDCCLLITEDKTMFTGTTKELLLLDSIAIANTLKELELDIENIDELFGAIKGFLKDVEINDEDSEDDKEKNIKEIFDKLRKGV